jgi:Protein of unknown function (DUF973).
MIVGAYYVLKLSLGFLKLNMNACIKLGFIGGIFMIISLIIAALFPVFSIVSFHPIYKANAISNEQAAKIIVTSLIFTTALSIFLFLISNVFLGIGFYGVGERYQNSLVSIGGIIGIVLPFIGYFITYAGLSKVIKQLIT